MKGGREAASRPELTNQQVGLVFLNARFEHRNNHGRFSLLDRFGLGREPTGHHP